jgi:hypothetical protein
MKPETLQRREFKQKYAAVSFEAQLATFQELQKAYTQNPQNEILKQESNFLVSNILNTLKLSRGTKSLDMTIDHVASIDSKLCEKSIQQGFLKKLMELKVHKIAGKANPFHVSGGGGGNGTGLSNR